MARSALSLLHTADPLYFHLPAITGLTLACNANSCPAWPMSEFTRFHATALDNMKHLDWWQSLWSWHAATVYLAWYAWTVLCWLILPGEIVQGAELRNGTRLDYKMNGQWPPARFTEQ